ncbi:putative UPF0561 protein C2orf68-like protein [Triplophysa rosa]|uniref:UPF0561 protein C2orf68-like protein n=1 Tax=Triplophysa rosa TaxID=992332 RepID=A0A9W7T5H1_TRIRA|nr:putative UPF0561 protein C2orf68-like protein [Triplophysa rosa]
MDKVSHDAESNSVKFKPGGRLDMSHGFLRHIRRNQIARDDYDREVKQAKEKQRRRPFTTPRHPKRPDQQVYHLRHQISCKNITRQTNAGATPKDNRADFSPSDSPREKGVSRVAQVRTYR